MPAPAASAATFDTFRAELTRLVERFDRQHPTFTSPDYNEATLRADFLDPLFRALGWDVGNQKGLIHTEREVDIEVRTHMSGRQTRADYVFRVARTDRFTCEAKKPAEALHNRHIFQAKRDAFNRGIPLALLSDFEELKIFVVGARPVLDEPHTGEWKVLHFRQYPDAARELWDLLAYENVAAGSVDRLIDSLPKRPLKLKGRQGYLIKPDRTRSLDTDFLNFLDGVRQQLGSDLLKHNDRTDLLQGHRLNEAAQRIIDRLVFLRICEDRGIDTGTLLETLFRDWFRQQPESHQPKLRKVSHQTQLRFGRAADEDPAGYDSARRTPAEGGLYRELTEHIRALDQRPPSYKPFFNGQLFKPHFSEDLVVGDEWLANFILDLTSDDSGYNFADIKVEILGDAYERFLGHILVPKGRGTAIEEKPEVRKAGGVYYTPRYITDYIVEQTIGRLLDGKTPKEVEKLRFLDPACGSGSFLIRAYERVMEHYLRYFTANPDKRRKDDCFVDAAGNVRLTTALKRRILENNIYGVDIDAQAVEVTQLSLYLKMLEGENRDTLRQQTELFRDQALLPSLSANIKCFNSLIGSDFSLDPAELVRVNAGDWDVHFEAIMKAGGFDAVVGNPPYGRLLGAAGEAYVEKALPSFSTMPDIYIAFSDRALHLLRPHGRLSFIVPSAWTGGIAYQSMRESLLRAIVEKIIELPFNVFEDAYVDTAIFVATKSTPSTDDHALCFQYPKKQSIDAIRINERDFELVPVALWRGDPSKKFVLSAWALRLMTRLRGIHIRKLDAAVEMRRGVLFNSALLSPKKTGANSHPYFEGDVYRYRINFSAPSWVEYGPQMSEWPKEFKWFEGPRILLRRLVNRQQRLMAAFEERTVITNKNLYSLLPKSNGDKRTASAALMALVNSRLLSKLYLSQVTQATKDDFPQVTIQDVLALPLPNDLEAHIEHLSSMAAKLQKLTEASEAAKTDAEKATLQNAVTKTDREIDQLVYQLYGLTPDEIALVEGTAAPAPQAD